LYPGRHTQLSSVVLCIALAEFAGQSSGGPACPGQYVFLSQATHDACSIWPDVRAAVPLKSTKAITTPPKSGALTPTPPSCAATVLGAQHTAR